MIKKWIIKKPAPKKFIESFPEFHPIVLQLLYNRGITSKEEIERFLNPDWERDLFNPFLMKGMKEAVERLKKAIKNKEKIGLFGHFDVDGVSATALLYLVLKKIGLSPLPYLPDRKEGFGLNEKALKELKDLKIKLLITVDTGTSSYKEVELAKKWKMDIIITDHHEIPQKLPSCPILNPNQKGCSYPFKELAGVGVTFKLASALSTHFPLLLPSSYLKWLVDLVCLGTICDIVPLISENRLFAKFGLIVLNKTRRIGLEKLSEKAQVEFGKIDPYTVSFILGPRLNAPGRIDHANASFYLLTTENPQEAERLAKILDDYNKERQAILEKTLEEAKKEIEEKSLFKNKLILVGKEDWPAGIIGLIASKLTDEYFRPTIALTIGKEKSKGSARSIETFHITEILSECGECLIRFGGHKKAAGFSLLTEKIEELRERLIKKAEERLTEEDVTPSLEIEAKIELKDLNWDLYESLEKFQPTGFGNKEPVFLSENVRVEDVRTVGEGKHLKLNLWGFDSIYFDKGELVSQIWPGDIIDVVYHLEADEWGNERRLQLKILDLRKKNG